MANSYIEYTSGLTATTYSVPFNVLSITDVNVKGYNGTTWSDLTVSSRDAVAKTVTLSGAPSAFQKIRVWRNTGTTQLVDFQNGSRLSESDLDTAYQQGLFVAQEVSENASTGALAKGETGAQGATGAAGADGSNAEPFQPVAVTGTTPSLNVGSYSFFDNGTLAANTTVSFASVPTEANWRYSCKTPFISTPWDLDYMVSVNSAFVPQGGTNRGIFFKPDGTKMFLCSDQADAILEYALSTAFDISTLSYTQSASVSSQSSQPRDMVFSSDGTKMYLADDASNNVDYYSLSTAWNISTLTPISATTLSGGSGPRGIQLNSDGTKLYVVDAATVAEVNEYTLSTAYNPATMTLTNTFDVSDYLTASLLSGLQFKTDGTKMFVMGASQGIIVEYSLSTAWLLSSSTYTATHSLLGQFVDFSGTINSDFAIGDDGENLYLLEGGRGTVLQSALKKSYTITLPAAVENTPSATLKDGGRLTYEFYTVDGGTTVTLIGEEIV
jgi:DNA-binding beta-propeller fold protein YncE